MSFDVRFSKSLRSAGELAESRPHGDRLKYMSGCRCMQCRAANSRYETERAAARRRGEWNGFVDAADVRHHLQMLSKRGIGRDTVSELSGICVSTVDVLRTGKRKNIRAMNAKRILSISVDAVVNDAQLVDAGPTMTRIRWMLNEGFTKTEIARRLGYKTHALQIRRGRITARNAMKVEKLYNMLRLGDDE